MIQENFEKIYRKFRLELYRQIFGVLGEREGSLTVSEFFSVEVIYLLENPTVGEFAKTLSISLPNATYKVRSLIEKGYIRKEETHDKRTFRLAVTDKFLRYYHSEFSYGQYIFDRLSERLSREQLAQVDSLFEDFISQIDREKEEKKQERSQKHD